MDIKTICPCCGQYNFKVPNFYEVCPVCKWRDDLLQRTEPDMSGANKLSLNEHKSQWEEIQVQQRYAEIVKLFMAQTPIDIIAEKADKSIEAVKSFLSQCGFKEVIN